MDQLVELVPAPDALDQANARDHSGVPIASQLHPHPSLDDEGSNRVVRLHVRLHDLVEELTELCVNHVVSIEVDS